MVVLLSIINNIQLSRHYVVTGAPDTPYEGGYYHGKLVFPPDFPFRPPAICEFIYDDF
jgi:ubiquitin-protein ligase